MNARTNKLLRIVFFFAFDAILTYALFFFACWASLDASFFSGNYTNLYLVGIPWALLVPITLLCCGTYRVAMSRIGLFESLLIVFVTSVVDLVCYVALFIIQNVPGLQIPWILNWRTFLLMVIAHVFLTVLARFVPRVLRAVHFRLHNRHKGHRAILIGAGDAAKILIDESHVSRTSDRVIVACFDDDRRKVGTTLGGVPVVGKIEHAPEYIATHDIEEAIIAIPSLSKTRYLEITRLLSKCEARLRKVPALSELDKVNEVKVVDIDYRDLLGSPTYFYNEAEAKAKYAGKNVLITGGGGSLGGAIGLELLRLGIHHLVLLDRYENGVAEIAARARDFCANNGLKDVKISVTIASIDDEETVRAAFLKYHPDFVFHTAALKHVPLGEDHPYEAVKTNVYGTDIIARACLDFDVQEMHFLSTDKAIAPDSLMAKTKRIGEWACLHYAKAGKTRFTCLRFGNVLASKGSVVPIFAKQIEAGGPLTVTSEDASRYFLTLEDATKLLLSAAMCQEGGIYDIETGKSVSILSLAESLIRQAGYIPYKDIQIKITGLRHGESTPKDTPYDRSKQRGTEHPSIFMEDDPGIADYAAFLAKVKKTPHGIEAKEYVGTLFDKALAE